MKISILQVATLFVGVIVIVSSLFFIESASEYKYEMQLERDRQSPGSVSNDAWIMSRDEAGMAFFVLMVAGIPAFLLISFCALISSAIFKKLRPFGFVLGVSWICFGILCHFVVWII